MHASTAPQCLVADERSGADAARQRLTRKSRFNLFASLRSQRHLTSSTSESKVKNSKKKDQLQDSDTTSELSLPPQNQAALVPDPIHLDDSGVSLLQDDKDVYRWAVLYENQRGIIIFSTPYYSRLSLLPTDPAPFTVPSASFKRAAQANVSLTEYPLPDGTWHWVSKFWMIDMRSDSGEVQHDGFEYNWIFRKNKWRAEVGTLGAGGWVRRRRWVRLMMRPARTRKESSWPRRDNWLDSSVVDADYKRPAGLSLPPSVIGTDNPEDEAFGLDADEIWHGDDVEQDWESCRAIMKRVGRDGRNLELWKRWLGAYVDLEDVKGKKKQKQWTEDDTPLPSEVEASNRVDGPTSADTKSASLEHITGVLRAHGDSLLRLFVFPDSRAQFLNLLGSVGLLPELNIELGVGYSASEVDFWSYVNRVEDRA